MAGDSEATHAAAVSHEANIAVIKLANSSEANSRNTKVSECISHSSSFMCLLIAGGNELFRFVLALLKLAFPSF